MSYVVVRVSEDIARGTTVETFGPYADPADAERYRRKLLAIGAERYMPRQRPKVQVSRMEMER